MTTENTPSVQISDTLRSQAAAAGVPVENPIQLGEAAYGIYFSHEDNGGDGRYHFVSEASECGCGHPYRGQRPMSLESPDLGFAPPEGFCDVARAKLGGKSAAPAPAPEPKPAPLTPEQHGQALEKAAARAAVPFRPKDTQEMFRYAGFLANSGLIPFALRGKPNDILVVLLKGQDLGLTPMQSIAGINVIDGKAEVGALLMVSMILKSGMCEYWRLVHSDTTRAVYKTKRRGDPDETVFEYTIEEAEAAGLTKKGGDAGKIARSPWNTQRRTMLRRRAQSFLAREVYPDIVAGLYDHDELAEIRELQNDMIRAGMEATRAGFLADPQTLPGWMASGAADANSPPPTDAAPAVEVLPKPAPPVEAPRDPMKERLRQRAEAAKPAQPTLAIDPVCSRCQGPVAVGVKMCVGCAGETES